MFAQHFFQKKQKKKKQNKQTRSFNRFRGETKPAKISNVQGCSLKSVTTPTASRVFIDPLSHSPKRSPPF